MHPLPHGTTRAGLIKCLKSWGWAAKPLQPVRGGPEGAGWHVGSGTQPPSAVLQGAHGDVVVTKVRSVVNTKEAPSILGSFKTKAHLRSQTRTSQPPRGQSNASASSDPWLQHDPWQAFKPTQPQRFVKSLRIMQHAQMTRQCRLPGMLMCAFANWRVRWVSSRLKMIGMTNGLSIKQWYRLS